MAIDATEKLNSINWEDTVVYDVSSPTFLRWKHKRVGKNGCMLNRGNNGIAGSITTDGLLSIGILKSLFSIPKVIWILHKGNLAKGTSVYFKDGNHLNARIENLYIKDTFHKPKEKYSDELFKYLEYDTNSSSCLRWISKSSKSTNISVGSVAGSLDVSDNYWKIHGLGHHYKVHRIVWFMHNGKIEKDLNIDHINGIRTDNRIENLRAVPTLLNARNRSKNSNNKTGHNMIQYKESFSRNGTPLASYIVCISTETNKRSSKSFSCLKYGKESAFQMALDYRDSKLKELNEQGFGYTERHGT